MSRTEHEFPQPDLLPYSFKTLVTQDIDELVEAYKSWNQSYQKLTPGDFLGQFTEANFAGFSIHRETLNQPMLETGQGPKNCYTFCTPLKIKGEGYANGHIFDESLLQRQVLMLGVNSDMEFHTPSFIDNLVVSIPQEILTRYVATVEGWDITPMLSQATSHFITKPQPEKLSTALLSVLQRIQDSPQQLSQATTQQLLKDFILEQLLLTLKKALEGPQSPIVSINKSKAVASACNYIEAHPERLITVAELCTITGVSRSTLQGGFKKHFGMSPKEYLRVRRLNGARRDLLVATPKTAKVTDIATAWGFWHLGAFGQAYKTLFGELPSQTLKHRGN